MQNKTIKATLLVAFVLMTGILTYFGLNTSKATIDFDKIANKSNIEMGQQELESFENTLKNIGSSTSLVKPDVLKSDDTARLRLSIQLLDSNKQYLYAAVLSEKLSKINNNFKDYQKTSRYFLMELYKDDKQKNELMLSEKAKENLEQSLRINNDNLDAKVDLAVTIFNINKLKKAPNQQDLMKPALLLREVVAKDSNHIDGIFYLGKLSVESNQLEKAIVRFKKILSLQPQNGEVCAELSHVYSLMGNKEESKKWADEAQKREHKHINN